MRTLPFLFLHLLALCLAVPQGCAAQQNGYDVFYLAVGSSHYRAPPAGTPNDSYPFTSVPGANTSARHVASYLSRLGSRYGVTLLSTEDKLVTRSDVFDRLGAVIQRARRSGSKRPLVVFYFAGHGISEGIAWNHFSVPGDFTFTGDISRIDVEDLAARTIHSAEVVDALKESQVAYLAIFDNCSAGQEASFASRVLGQALERNMRDVAAVMRFMNEFHEPHPVLFSTTPGQEVYEVADPSDPGSAISIAPLARRVVLVLQRAIDTGSDLTMDNFVRAMTDPSLDGESGPAVTHVESGNGEMLLADFPVQVSQAHEVAFGTGSPLAAAVAGCRAEPDAPAAPGPVSVKSASLTLRSEPGDWIGQGKTYVLGPNTSQVDVEMISRSEIVLHFTTGDVTWDLAFAAPHGKDFQVREYSGASRHPFQGSDEPGLSISGDSRGCNEVGGSFRVREVEYGPGGDIDRLAVDFVQYCDGKQSALRGAVRLNSSLALPAS